jgi:hypothetical protein
MGQVELLIAFFGLPNAIDNPLPLIVIKANFSYQKVNTCINNPPFGQTNVFDVLFGQHDWLRYNRWIPSD